MVPLPLAEPISVESAIGRYAEEAGKRVAADIRRFFEWQTATESRDLDGYLRHLLKRGLSRGTADKVRREVQAFYRFWDLPAPKVRGWHYDPRSEGQHDALSQETVGRMIAAARQSAAPHLVAMLCLGTVYGFRAGEIAAVGPKDLDFAGERIFARTEKDGRRVWQWMPPELHRHLRPWQGPQAVRLVQAGFGHLWAAASDAPRPDRIAWHSIRRALVVELRRAGVPDEAVGHFMRWAGGGSRDGAGRMVEWYGTPTGTVGTDGTVAPPEASSGTREEDAEVWRRHPWLPLWR